MLDGRNFNVALHLFGPVCKCERRTSGQGTTKSALHTVSCCFLFNYQDEHGCIFSYEQCDANVGQGSGAGHLKSSVLIAHCIYRNVCESWRVSRGVEGLCYLSLPVSLTS